MGPFGPPPPPDPEPLTRLNPDLQPCLRPLAGHGGQHDHLGCGEVVQVVHLHLVHALLPGRLGPLLSHVQVALHIKYLLFSIFDQHNLAPDWIWIGIQPKMLDLDPYQMNCLYMIRRKFCEH